MSNYGLNIDGDGVVVGLWFAAERGTLDEHFYITLDEPEARSLLASLDTYTSKAEKTQLAYDILDSEDFMWLMSGADPQWIQAHLNALRPAYIRYRTFDWATTPSVSQQHECEDPTCESTVNGDQPYCDNHSRAYDTPIWTVGAMEQRLQEERFKFLAALDAAIDCIHYLEEQQAMPDDGYKPLLQQVIDARA